MQNTNEYVTDLGHLHLRIEEILDERGISKNKLCKDMDIPRTNFNRYCQDKQTRWDLKFLCKLCLYLIVFVLEGRLRRIDRVHTAESGEQMNMNKQ